MHVIDPGKNPRETLLNHTQSPVAYFDALYLSALPNEASKCPVPLLDTTRVTPEAAYLAWGMAQLGSWYNGSRKRVGSLQHLLIHWPSLVAQAWEHFDAFPPAALLLGCFREIFSRASFFVGELLERHLLTQVAHWVHPGVSLPVVPLETAEVHLFREWMRALSRNPDMIRALKTSFDAAVVGNLLPADMDYGEFLDSHRAFILNYKREEFSVLSLHRVITYGTRIPPRFSILNVDTETFGAADINTLAYELLFAHKLFVPEHLASSSLAVQWGVFPAEAERVLMINFKRFFEYRKRTASVDKYIKQVFTPLKTQRVALPTHPGHIAEYVQTHYKHLQRFSGESIDLRQKYFGTEASSLWLPDEWASTVFLNSAKLQDFFVHHRYTRFKQSAGAVKRKPRERLYQNQTYHSPSGSMYTFIMTRHKSEWHFSPPWDTPEMDLSRNSRMYKGQWRKQFLPGAFEDHLKRRLFMNVQRLCMTTPFQQKNIPGLREWLENLSRMPLEDFRSPRGYRSSAGRQPFTYEEDQAIYRYYHPNASEKDLLALKTVCAKRTDMAISMRASALCNLLIESGEYSLGVLPHRKYNANLRKKIAAAMAASTKKDKPNE